MIYNSLSNVQILRFVWGKGHGSRVKNKRKHQHQAGFCAAGLMRWNFKNGFWTLFIIFDKFEAVSSPRSKEQIKKGMYLEKIPAEKSPASLPPCLLWKGITTKTSNELIRVQPCCVLSSWTVPAPSPPQHLMTFCSVDNLGHRDYI